MIIAVLVIIVGGLLAWGMNMNKKSEKTQSPTPQAKNVAKKVVKEPVHVVSVKKDTAKVVKPDYKIEGTLTDQHGKGVAGVIVSDGYQCVLTDSLGRYKMTRNKDAAFVYYSVPEDCEVPTHSSTDNTACFYLPVEEGKKVYDFQLKRMPLGKEYNYKMIVIGDPQVTNAKNPYYESADDNRITKSDLERFTNETMADIRRTIEFLPKGTAVYGLSMGDDVQYYGGYNEELERNIRKALGSTEMKLFSVIGNHDQDGKKLYRQKWEESFGPTDFSFNRGDEHFVCINSCFFTKGAAYYSPAELHEAQMNWLKQDLALTSKNKKVVLCYHVPFTFGTSPYGKAQSLRLATEEGHFSSSRLSMLLYLLRQFEGGYELFCGHTHFSLNHEIEYEGHHVMERCHAAACGNIWQSDVNICGTPNGYYVYTFSGKEISDCYYKGTFWEWTKQMSLFRAQTEFNGESYATDWNLDKHKNILVVNVFNADSRWRVVAIENGEEHRMQRINSKGQDAFAAGYHKKYAECAPFYFVSKKNNYLLMNHLFYYVPKDTLATITVKAYDPYGHVYKENSEQVVTEPFYNYAHYYKAEAKKR